MHAIPVNKENKGENQASGCLVVLFYIPLVLIISITFFVGLILIFLPQIGSVLSIWLIVYIPIAILISAFSFVFGKVFIRTKSINYKIVMILFNGLLVCFVAGGGSYLILGSL